MSKLRIVSYNIRHALGMDEKINLGRIGDLLSQINAAIIFLQEVDMGRPRSNILKQAAILAKKLDMTYAYGPVNRYKMGSYGNAILSKYPILSISNHLLPAPIDKRCCLQVEVAIDKQAVSLFNTHLGLEQKIRYENIKNVILPLTLSCKNPLILAGDFNAPAQTAEIKLLSSYLKDTFLKNSGPITKTYSSTNPTARIDYIFINHAFYSNDFYIVDSIASDHLPIVAEIKIP